MKSSFHFLPIPQLRYRQCCAMRPFHTIISYLKLQDSSTISEIKFLDFLGNSIFNTYFSSNNHDFLYLSQKIQWIIACLSLMLILAILFSNLWWKLTIYLYKPVPRLEKYRIAKWYKWWPTNNMQASVSASKLTAAFIRTTLMLH